MYDNNIINTLILNLIMTQAVSADFFPLNYFLPYKFKSSTLCDSFSVVV